MHFARNTSSAFRDESAAFVALAWNELFDPTTPDSYRPRLYDTRGLVAELSSLAELAAQDNRWFRHIELVQRELRSAVKDEACWLDQSPWSSGIIDNIASATELAQVADLADVFRSTSPDPVSSLFECLHREIASLPRNKKRTLRVLGLLGTQAIRSGLTASDVALNFRDARDDDQTAVVKRLIGSLEPTTRPFTCVVHLMGDESQVHSLFGQNGFQQARTKDFPLDSVGQDFKNSVSRHMAFRHETNATSHLAAAAHTVQACRRVIDVFNLYQNRASIELDADVLVVDDLRTAVVSRNTEKSLATKPSRAALKLTREALARVRFDHLDLGLENSLEQHSLALSSTEPKASLVGIWTALECLVGSDGRDSSSRRVVEWIAPIVALRRVEKISRYLAVCCHEYFGAASRRPSHAFKRSSPYYVSPRDILDAITGPKDNTLMVQLLGDVSDHPLLRFRMYYAWRSFHDPKIVKRELLGSKQRLVWHLERIYRARNLTVHQGRTPPFVSELVDRVQHYYTRCVSRVLADLREHTSWTVPTALERHRQRFQFVVQRLNGRSHEIPGSFFFPRDDEFRECFPWKQST